ncbi:hypothetical protein KVR01_004487 [Diaporthe batatas]|uniref:uncharacterized protein n=1 Tax=Diaporthe batatas TaxID=748121 RepID=UPI001D035EF4|nr:uncharacterized protein KVR01_004487 [Diaporthe batatas]KAG8165935.1 hypothetical protein KVR01_004487 [Diaporthe batatas]
MPRNDDKTTPAPPPQEQQQQQQQPPPETLIYFAFGSNLSSTQMRARCPGAEAVGLAYLPGYEFIINERGFANVVTTTANHHHHPNSSSTNTTAPAGEGGGDVVGGVVGVYGVLYRLASAAEKARLDAHEGVPLAYEDLVLEVERKGEGRQLVAPGATASSPRAEGTVRALVYVDRRRVSPAAPRAEYVVRMNRGIREAVAEWGLPRDYVRGVMRRYIPADGDGAADEC